MAKDPKLNAIEGRRRVLTIHDGAGVTPTLVRVLQVLAEDAERFASESPVNDWRRDRHVPILVGRADGVAVYVQSRRVL